jgi:hypothetical protein
MGGNTVQLAHIEEQINKLIRAEKSAKRRRDISGALAISRELRNWLVLKAKADAAENAGQSQTDATISRGEALAVAQGLIESEVNVGGQEIITWLLALAERVRPTGSVPDVQE